jgi:hypothetical protein
MSFTALILVFRRTILRLLRHSRFASRWKGTFALPDQQRIRPRHNPSWGTIGQAAASLKLNRGLADIEDIGSLRQASMPDDGVEQAKQMEVEGHDLSLLG